MRSRAHHPLSIAGLYASWNSVAPIKTSNKASNMNRRGACKLFDFLAKFIGSALSERAPSTLFKTPPIHRNEPYYFVTLPMEADGCALQAKPKDPPFKNRRSEAKTFAETPCLRM